MTKRMKAIGSIKKMKTAAAGTDQSAGILGGSGIKQRAFGSASTAAKTSAHTGG